MRVAVVGGGLAGMAAAITLASNGVEVHLYERSDALGGKIRAYQLDNAGSDIFLIPNGVRQVFNESGVKADDYLTFIPLERHTLNVHANGDRLYFSNNIEEMKAQIRQFSTNDADNYDDFIQEITRMYELVYKHLLNRSFFDFKEYLHPTVWSAILRVKPFETLEKFIRRYFSHPFVVQCFLRYGTYLGSSPYKIPASFAMSAYLELVEGVYTVNGGLSAIVSAFERRLNELNVFIHLNSEVTDLYKFRHIVHTLEVNGELDETFDATFFNADVLQHKKKLAFHSVDTQQPTTSSIVVRLRLNKRIETLRHRTVYFTDNYEEEFDYLFSDRYPEDATVTIGSSFSTNRLDASEGDEVLIFVNAPPLTSSNALTDEEAYQYVLTQLKNKGIQLEKYIVHKEVITPQTIREQFAAFRGALYGSASNSFKSAFFRPRNRHPIYRNVYFVGGTVHPGGGLPFGVLGGINVAKRFIEEYKKTTL